MAAPTFKLDQFQFSKRALGLQIWAARRDADKLARPKVNELAGFATGRLLDIELGMGEVPTDSELSALAKVLEVNPEGWITKARALRAAEAENTAGGEGKPNGP